jgi:TolB-like protein
VKRRAFITLLGGAAAAWPLAARAQQPAKRYRIGMLETVSPALNAAQLDAFRSGLRELGYVEGQTYAMEYRSADGYANRFPELAVELVRLGVDLIGVRGTPAAIAAKNATGTIPIVMALSFGFEDMGEQTVKNIARPIGIHRIELAEVTGPAVVKSTMADPKPELAGSNRPSLAVLPFANMSGDPEQEYFADGISEDIITGLSKLRWFFVIARNSSFTYKGNSVDVKRVARELGVRYVLEGSVRKGGNRVRITTQLIDAATGNHIWADRYDGDLTDVFALQDEITKKVVAAIEPRLLEAEGIRSQSRSTIATHGHISPLATWP